LLPRGQEEHLNDGFVSDDLAFSAGLCYAFGEESLTKVELISGKRDIPQFHFDAASLDCSGLREDFDKGEFAISDLKSYVRAYNKLLAILKQMRRDQEPVWYSSSWIAGRKSTGERIR
jgi:hypothetical protein